jgi:hypothetical protein
MRRQQDPATGAARAARKRRLWTPLAPEARKAALAAYLAWLGFSLLAQLVNAALGARDIAQFAMDAEDWEPFAWELTSWLGYALAAPLVLALDAQLVARGTRAPLRALACAGASLAFSAVHLFVMFGGRTLVYAQLEESYVLGSISRRFAEEYPKDVAALLILLGVAWFWRRALAPPPAPPSDPR